MMSATIWSCFHFSIMRGTNAYIEIHTNVSALKGPPLCLCGYYKWQHLIDNPSDSVICVFSQFWGKNKSKPPLLVSKT